MTRDELVMWMLVWVMGILLVVGTLAALMTIYETFHAMGCV